MKAETKIYSGREMKHLKIILMTIIVIAICPLMFKIQQMAPSLFDAFGRTENGSRISYQIVMLTVSFLVITIVSVMTKGKGLSFLSLKKRDGEVIPAKWAGIVAKEGETWRNIGLSMTITISIITAVVIYFQVFKGSSITPQMVSMIPIVLLLSLLNSFNEEIIFRFSFVAVADSLKLPAAVAQLLSAVTFGAVHYWGTPSGIGGVIMAAFIGWFLVKSMQETRGFFWAWLIHFIQDVIIVFALLAGTSNTI